MTLYKLFFNGAQFGSIPSCVRSLITDREGTRKTHRNDKTGLMKKKKKSSVVGFE